MNKICYVVIISIMLKIKSNPQEVVLHSKSDSITLLSCGRLDGIR